jgi:hypothetical protein
MGLPKRRYAAHTCISISGTNTKYSSSAVGYESVVPDVSNITVSSSSIFIVWITA